MCSWKCNLCVRQQSSFSAQGLLRDSMDKRCTCYQDRYEIYLHHTLKMFMFSCNSTYIPIRTLKFFTRMRQLSPTVQRHMP